MDVGKILGICKTTTSIWRSKSAIARGVDACKGGLLGTISKTKMELPSGTITCVNGVTDAGKNIKALGFLGKRGQRVVFRPDAESGVWNAFYKNCSESYVNEAAMHLYPIFC